MLKCVPNIECSTWRIDFNNEVGEGVGKNLCMLKLFSINLGHFRTDLLGV